MGAWRKRRLTGKLLFGLRIGSWRSNGLKLTIALVAVPLLLGATTPSGEILPGAQARHAPSVISTARHTPALADLITPARHLLPQEMLDHATIDGAFARYYADHDGPQLLGRPITPALPRADGAVIQFFEDGALALRGRQDQPARIRPNGEDATDHTIVCLSLLDDLLSLGSTAPVVGDGSSLTYADLRRAIQTASRPPDVSLAARPSHELVASSSMGPADGYAVPPAIWAYITRPDVAPGGWQQAFGTPLTPPLSIVTISPGELHRGIVQAFSHGAVYEDDATDADDQPAVERLRTGIAYLETVGLPDVAVPEGTGVWTATDTSLSAEPGGSLSGPHLGSNLALRLKGDVRWAGGTLWYQASWQTSHASGTGWVSANDITHAAPASGTIAELGFDVLAPDLFSYLRDHGDSVGAMVYDTTDDICYSYNMHGQFTVASSVKVPIMLTFLAMTEGQGREPNDQEMALLTSMIEQSNNDSAQALWDEIGGGWAVQAFLQAHGIAEFAPDISDGWGWSTISPAAMVTLLTLLHGGNMLTAQDRALALSLMSHTESDQQIGVGDTAPAGASVAMKDGWVPGPDGLWVMNSSGIVTIGHKTYIISVYSQHLPSLDEGWEIVRHVCGEVAHALA